MAEHTITLHQYNLRQKPNHKATERGVVLDETDLRGITRVVQGKGLVTFNVPRILPPALAARLADYLKFNIEVDGKHHDGATKYSQDDFVRGIWSHVRVAPLVEA